jgi:hypothetical protein
MLMDSAHNAPPVVDRGGLVDRIVSSGARVVTLSAPAGYGKSRLAQQLGDRYGALRTIDCADVTDASSAVSSVVRALAPLDANVRERIGRQILGLSHNVDSDAQAMALVVEALQGSQDRSALCLDNLEALAGNSSLQRIFDVLLRDDDRICILCSRVEVASPSLARIPPNERYDVRTEDLRFTDDETVSLLKNSGADASDARRGTALAQGWPIAALTFARYAREGHLSDSLSLNERSRSLQVLQDYVLSQALERLSAPVRSVLAAVARVGIVSNSEIRLMTDNAAVVAAETHASPFCIETEDGLSLHPLARAALRVDALGVAPLRHAARALAEDNPLRAARFFLAIQDDDAAAAVMDTRIMPFLSVQPTSEIAGLIADIQPDVLVRHQATWCATLSFRAYAVSPHQWLQEARTAFETLTPDAPKALWFGVGIVLLNFLYVSAQYAEAERVSATLFALFADEGEGSPYQVVLRFWRRFGELRQGQAIDLDATWAEAEPVIGPIPASVAQFLISFNGPIALFQGDRDDARRTFDRAIELSLDPAAEMSQVLALKSAAFHAWLAGETEAFSGYVERLAHVDAPNVRRGIRHFLGCARGDTPADTPTDFEMLYTRVFGALIAASREHDLQRRVRALRLAEDAAIEDAQPWLCALVQLAIGLSVPERRAAAFAAAIAASDRSEYATFRANVAEVIAGPIPDHWTGLSAFCVPTLSRLTVRFASRGASVGGTEIRLAQRETELLLVLALSGVAHDRRTLAAILWPDRNEADGANAVRVLVSRLRRKLGNAEVVRSTPAGYDLSTAPDVDLFTLETALAAGNGDRIPHTLREQLLEDHEHLPKWMLTSDWLRPYVRRYEAAVGALRTRAARGL